MEVNMSDTNAINPDNPIKLPPIIQSITEAVILDLKIFGSEKLPVIRKKYFSKLKSILKKKKYKEEEKIRQLDFVFNHLKNNSRIPYILTELMSLISSELKTTVKLKPAVILKALYCLFRNDEVLIQKNVSCNIVCTSSLKKFLANSLKCCVLGFLLKDIAADMLCESGGIFLYSSAANQRSCNFHYLQGAHEDLYGATVAWLSSMTPETGAKLVHWEALHNNTFSDRAVNFPKMFARLVAVCEYHVYCCLPSQIADVSLNEIHSLYNLRLVNQVFINLIRNEAVYTPISYMMYEPRASKPFQFSELLFEVKSELLHSSPCERRERDMPDFSCKPPPRKKRKKSPKNFYASETCSSYMGDESFWSYWDVFSGTETCIDFQLAFYGHLSPLPHRWFDIYSWEKASICYMSTSSSDSNPFNLKLQGQDVYDPFRFKLTDGNIQFWPKKS